MKKKISNFTFADCLYCGKKNLVRDSTDTGWCNDIHKKNYGFDHRTDDNRFKI